MPPEPNAVEELMSLGGGTGTDAPEVVINDLSYDVDFRVETNATTHALFVDGGSDHVRIDAAQGLHLKDLGTHASTPASGFGVIYVNGDVPYFKTDGGTATSMIAGVAALHRGAQIRRFSTTTEGRLVALASLNV